VDKSISIERRESLLGNLSWFVCTHKELQVDKLILFRIKPIHPVLSIFFTLEIKGMGAGGFLRTE
jgi:hypothetical protein